MADIGKLILNAIIDTNGYVKGANDINKSNEQIKKSTSDAAKSADNSSQHHNAFGAVMTKIGGLAKAAATTIVAGSVAVGTATIAIGKSALSAYSTYQQAVGGVDTLFKDSSATVQQYAANAYKTAGVSANTYMNQVTSFAASLVSSLGGDTKKAAELGNTALTDMSDNANKMGSSIESIQGTYQSLARGNYAMLDNLKLGYGGTKTEMERMIQDANKVKVANGEMGDLSIDKFSDVVSAIHIMQGEMGITGTTAKEAATTVEGSVNMMKASWENWLTALGNPDADLSGMTQELIGSFNTVMQNVMPVISQILAGIGAALPEVVKTAAAILPGLLGSFGGSIISSLGSLLSTVMDMLTSALSDQVPAALGGLTTWIQGNLPALAQQGMDMVLALAEGVISNVPALIDVAAALVTGLADGISQNVEQIGALAVNLVGSLVSGIIEHIPDIANAALQLAGAFTDSIIGAIGAMPDWLQPIAAGITAVAAAFGIWTAAIKAWSIITKIGTAIQTAFNFVMSMNPISLIIIAITALVGALVWFFTQTETGKQIWQSFMSWLQTAWQAISDFFTGLWDGIVSVFNGAANGVQTAWTAVVDFFTMIGNTISSIFTSIGEFISTVWNGIYTTISTILTNIYNFVAPIIQGIYTVIYDVLIVIAAIWVTIWNTISGAFTAVWNAMVSFFTPIIQAISTTISSVISGIQSTWSSIWGAISSFFSALWNGMKNTFTPIINAISSTISAVLNAISSTWSSIWNGISTFFGAVWNGVRNVAATVITAIASVISGVINGIRGTWTAVWSGISSFFSGIWNGMTSAVSSAVNAIGGIVGGIKNTIMGALSGAGSWLTSVGRDIISGLIGGITGAFTWLKNTISNLGSSVVNWAKGVLHIGSPSKVMRDQIGKWIPAGIAVGVEANEDSALDAVGDMAVDLVAAGKVPEQTYTSSDLPFAGQSVALDPATTTTDNTDAMVQALAMAFADALNRVPSVKVMKDPSEAAAWVVNDLDDKLEKKRKRESVGL